MITKEESIQLKGMAILMMLFLHLFSAEADAGRYTSLVFFWNGLPLAVVLKRIMHLCVPMYLFLGGYGLSVTYSVSGGVMRNKHRIMRLYLNYWVVLLIFLPYACLRCPELFPGKWDDILLNILAISHSYNGTWWFLFPYIILIAVSCPLIGFFKKLDKKPTAAAVASLLMIYVGAYLTRGKNYHLPQYVALLVAELLDFLYLLFPFMLGVLFEKYRYIDSLKSWTEQKIGGGRRMTVVVAAVVTLFLFLKLCMGSSSIHAPIFAVVLICGYVIVARSSFINRFFGYFGRHSTNMWLVHLFFFVGVLDYTIYEFKYPILIWGVLVVLSLASSYIINLILSPVLSVLRSKR